MEGGLIWGGGTPKPTHVIPPTAKPTSLPDHRLLPLSTLLKPESNPPRCRRGQSSSVRLGGGGGGGKKTRVGGPQKTAGEGICSPLIFEIPFTMLGEGAWRWQPRLRGGGT